MRPHRVPAATRTAAFALAALVLLSGCGAAGGLKSAGDAPSAVEPKSLWPDLPPASAAPYDYGEGETARIPGIRVTGGDVRRLDPVTVAQAGLKAGDGPGQRPGRAAGRDGPADRGVPDRPGRLPGPAAVLPRPDR